MSYPQELEKHFDHSAAFVRCFVERFTDGSDEKLLTHVRWMVMGVRDGMGCFESWVS